MVEVEHIDVSYSSINLYIKIVSEYEETFLKVNLKYARCFTVIGITIKIEIFNYETYY